MKVNINSVHFKTDKNLDAFINEKVGKLSTLYGNLIGSEVTLKVVNTDKPENKLAEVKLQIKGNDLYAKKQCKSFEEAIDLSVDALKRQLTRQKEKMRQR